SSAHIGRTSLAGPSSLMEAGTAASAHRDPKAKLSFLRQPSILSVDYWPIGVDTLLRRCRTAHRSANQQSQMHPMFAHGIRRGLARKSHHLGSHHWGGMMCSPWLSKLSSPFPPNVKYSLTIRPALSLPSERRSLS